MSHNRVLRKRYLLLHKNHKVHVYLTDHRFSVKKFKINIYCKRHLQLILDVFQIFICYYQVSDRQSAVIRVDNKEANDHLDYLPY